MKFKLMINLLALMMIAAFAGFFFLKKPDGTHWLTVEDITPAPDIPAITMTRVYRWQENGQWSFASEPPEHIDPALVEMVEINPDTNLIQGLRSEKDGRELGQPGQSDTTIRQQDSEPGESPGLSGIPLPLTIQPDQLQQLFEDAQAIQQQMNQRADELNSKTDQ